MASHSLSDGRLVDSDMLLARSLSDEALRDRRDVPSLAFDACGQVSDAKRINVLALSDNPLAFNVKYRALSSS